MIILHAGIHTGNERILQRGRTLLRRSVASDQDYVGFRREYFKAAGFGELVTDVAT